MRVLPLNDLCGVRDRSEIAIAMPARERMYNTMKRTFRPPLTVSHSLHDLVHWLQCLHDENQVVRGCVPLAVLLDANTLAHIAPTSRPARKRWR